MPSASRTRSASRCSISTTSSATTTRTATPAAISYCVPPPRPGRPSCARATCWLGTAARSSRCCCPSATSATRWLSSSGCARSPQPAQTVSAGLTSGTAARRADALLERADAALYEAKAGGRDRAVVAGAATRRLSPRTGCLGLARAQVGAQVGCDAWTSRPSDRVAELLERVATFMAEHVDPVEPEALAALDDEVAPGVAYPRDPRRAARARARPRGSGICSCPTSAAAPG